MDNQAYGFVIQLIQSIQSGFAILKGFSLHNGFLLYKESFIWGLTAHTFLWYSIIFIAVLLHTTQVT